MSNCLEWKANISFFATDDQINPEHYINLCNLEMGKHTHTHKPQKTEQNKNNKATPPQKKKNSSFQSSDQCFVKLEYVEQCNKEW